MKQIFTFLSLMIVVTANAQLTIDTEIPDSVRVKLASAYARFANNKAADFSLQDPAGKLRRLHEFTGKTVVIDIWATTCFLCLQSMPYYNKMQQFFSDSTNIQFLSVCVDKAKNTDTWKKMLGEHHLQGMNLFLPVDEDNNRQENGFFRNTSESPTYLLIGKDGIIMGLLPAPDENLPMAYAIHRGGAGVFTKDAFTEILDKSDHFQQWLQKNMISILQLMGEN